MADAKALLSELLQRLSAMHARTFLPLTRMAPRTAVDYNTKNKQFNKAVYDLGMVVNNFMRKSKSITAASAADLAKFANYLDENGHYTEALEIDKLLITSHMKSALLALADNLDQSGHHELADKLDRLIEQSNENVTIVNNLIEMADSLDKKEEYNLAEAVDKVAVLFKTANNGAVEIQPMHEGNLSTRYCPDHRGVQSMRVAEKTYQCPIDGKVYNYEMGYVNYQGQKVPGGNVAAQTPNTSNFGGIPMRIYDSRQNVLRSMH